MKQKEITIQAGDKFEVTGYYYNGKRFPTITCTSWMQANGYNLWRGHVWLVRGGKRIMVKEVVN
jgi:hypothetical protein